MINTATFAAPALSLALALLGCRTAAIQGER
jgi:hypothetical protein